VRPGNPHVTREERAPGGESLTPAPTKSVGAPRLRSRDKRAVSDKKKQGHLHAVSRRPLGNNCYR